MPTKEETITTETRSPHSGDRQEQAQPEVEQSTADKGQNSRVAKEGCIPAASPAQPVATAVTSAANPVQTFQAAVAQAVYKHRAIGLSALTHSCLAGAAHYEVVSGQLRWSFFRSDADMAFAKSSSQPSLLAQFQLKQKPNHAESLATREGLADEVKYLVSKFKVGPTIAKDVLLRFAADLAQQAWISADDFIWDATELAKARVVEDMKTGW